MMQMKKDGNEHHASKRGAKDRNQAEPTPPDTRSVRRYRHWRRLLRQKYKLAAA
jgi:hypothetical protein